ncbi:hypothetical protein L218DRAFT_949270 [Marasmius fiardii PR-910]|nr:hypothetical protein L218DRAFT_949270 [Marasmius fiardii PR-910]
MLSPTLFSTFLFEATFCLGIASRSQLSRHICFHLLLWILYTTVLRQPSSGRCNGEFEYGTLLLVQTLIAFDFLVITKDLHRSFRRLDHKRKPELDISSAPFMTRLVWGLSLVMNPRGIGWEHGSSHRLPYNSPSLPRIGSRNQFLMRKIITLVESAGYFFLSSYITRSSVSSFLHIRIQAHGPVWGLITSVVWITRVIAYCNMLHLGLAVTMVGVGAWDYHQCPPLFGYWSEGYTLRRVWGRVWHQLLRRTLESHASFILSIFRITPSKHGTSSQSLYYFIRSLVAVLVSGLFHQTMSYISPPRQAYTTISSFLTGADIQLFFSQAVGLVIEAGGIWAWNKLGSTRNRRKLNQKEKRLGKGESDRENDRNHQWHRYLGYVWVITWCSWTLQRQMNRAMELELMSTPDFDPRSFDFNPTEMWKLLKS